LQHSFLFKEAIYLNTILTIFIQLLDADGLSASASRLYELINVSTIALFTIELLIKMCAFGARNYFVKSKHNLFDFFVVVCGIVDAVCIFAIFDE
jgi:hypothetical protein